MDIFVVSPVLHVLTCSNVGFAIVHSTHKMKSTCTSKFINPNNFYVLPVKINNFSWEPTWFSISKAGPAVIVKDVTRHGNKSVILCLYKKEYVNL